MAVALGVACSMAAMRAGAANQTADTKVRIGTYDARAIAVAYAGSALCGQQLKEKRKEQTDAEARGDKERVKELHAWGKAHQQRLHRQGFAGAPVDDILAQVKDRLPSAAEKARVAVITRTTDYVAAGAEVVDVTDELVNIFNPSEKTLKMIRELRKHPPLSVEEADKIED